MNKHIDVKIVTDLNELIIAQEKFSCIYADPPWAYSNQATRSATQNHYSSLSIKQLQQLPIIELVHDDAHLHLWTTNAFLFECKELMESWGFQYKSCFVWIKPEMGIGNYWRLSHEFLLFGLRGQCPFLNKSEKSWALHHRGKHSAKPEIIRNKIETTSPGPYLELFGRRPVKGWTVFGNQITHDLLG